MIPDLVIFDCDGVLVDSEMIASEVLAGEMVRLGLRATGAQCRARFTGLTFAEVIAGIEADLEGSFATFPMRVEADQLLINGWTRPGGSIRAEVVRLGEYGEVQVVEGYSMEDCEPIAGDCRFEPLTWREGSLSALSDAPVRLSPGKPSACFRTS